MNAKDKQLAVHLLNELLELVGSEPEPIRKEDNQQCGITYRSNGKIIDITPQDAAMAILFRVPGIPAEELAEMVGVHKSTLYRWRTVARTLRARKDYKKGLDEEQN